MIFVNPRAVRSSSKASAFVPATMAGLVAVGEAGAGANHGGTVALVTGAAVTVAVAVTVCSAL
jgi:hypothetical protein